MSRRLRRLLKYYLSLSLWGGSNGTGATPSKTPDEVSGLTGWWDASDITRMFVDAGSTPVSADGQAVYRFGDKSGVAGNRYFEQTVESGRPLYKVDQQNGQSGLLFDGIDDVMESIALSNFFSASIAYMFIVFKPISALVPNDQVFGDIAGYVYLTAVNGNDISMFNWDGNYDSTPAQSVPSNQAVLITAWHVGGNLYIQKNNGDVSEAVQSGNTTNLTAELGISKETVEPNMVFCEAATYNQSMSDSDKESLNLGLCQKWDIVPL